MANNPPPHTPRLSSPDPATSEANSSVHVQVDTFSNREGSSGVPSRSPSRAPDPSLARQATANSLATFLSAQSSSQTSQSDRAPAEDLLRDLIAVTESSSNAANAALHGVKRPHDDQATDEPLAKRDKLGEELDQMFASHPVHASATEPSVAMVSSASVNTPYPRSANGSPNRNPSESTVTPGTRSTLPIRATTRRPQWPSNGAEISSGGPSAQPDPAGSSSDDDDSEQPTER